MRFGYKYHDSSGQVCTGEIGAPSREDAFQALRGSGVRPMQMWELDPADDRSRNPTGYWARVSLIAGVAALIAGGGVYFASRETSSASRTDESPSTFESQPVRRIARPRPRRCLSLDRAACANGTFTNMFQHVSEAFLANFAQPGDDVRIELTDEIVADFPNALDDDIEILHDDSSDAADLKRIVAGLKEDARVYLESDKTFREYARAIRQRQLMEADYRRQVLQQVKDGTLEESEADAMLSSLGFRPVNGRKTGGGNRGQKK